MAKTVDEKFADDKIVSLFRKRKLLIGLIALFLILAAIIGVVTLYGLHTGGFTMSISDDLANAGVVLSETKDGNGVSQLHGPELASAEPMMQPQINENYVLQNDGDYKSYQGDYIGYTFYVKNSGTQECDMQSQIKVASVSRNVDSAIRVWVFTTRNDEIDNEGVIYQKADSVEKDYTAINTAYGPYKATTNFETNTTIATRQYLDFKPDDYLKISIILWIEGEDPDCTDENFYDQEDIDEYKSKQSQGTAGNIEGGSIKISMAFTAYKEKIVE